jgi:Tol biopolymer transport system component/DNA-binding winged helix-turn-helix (wHTH) protein
MTPERTGIFSFAGLVVDVRRQQVTRNGERIDLEPKAFRVLSHLIENRDRVVSKDELISEIWAGSFVTDNALTRVIAQIRKQLGDSARSPRFIETVATSGYRFVAIEEVAARPTRSLVPVAPMAHARSKPPSKWWWSAAAVVAVAIGAGAWRLGQWRTGDTPHVVGLQQITSSLAADQSPSFSPDGSQIAFSSNRSGSFEIYVRSLAPGSAERQITSDGGYNIEPAWSPTGQEIAYSSKIRGGIAVVPATGGTTRYITDTGSNPCWSPDGQTLVYGAGSLGKMNLWAVGLNGGPPRVLTNSGTPPGDHEYPKWLADGRHIVFSTFFPTKGVPWIVDAGTGRLQRIQIAADSVLFPWISGDFLYYSTPGVRGAAAPKDPVGVWRARMDSHWQAEKPELLIPAGGQTSLDLAVSADGSRIAVSQVRRESALWSLPLNRSGLPAGDPKRLVHDASLGIRYPAFSPDGSKIAYSSMRQGGDWTVFIAAPNGSSPYPITSSGHMISWLGNNSLGYIGERDGRNEYWIAPLHGPPRRMDLKLDLGPYAVVVGSPRGDRLVAHSGDRKTGIKLVLVDLATGESRDLTPSGRTFVFPSWSPDGQWISAVERIDPKIDRRVFIDVATGAIQNNIESTDDSILFPSNWAPDNDRIVFANVRDGVCNLFWSSRSGGKVRQLTHFESQSEAADSPTWSPHGDQIVFSRSDLVANIYMVKLRF